MIETQFDPSQELLYFSCSGTLTLYDIMSTMIGAYEDPNFDPAYGVVWLVADCELNITIHEITLLPDEVITLVNQSRPAGKTAWVTPSARDDATFQLLYEQHAWATQWRTFHTREAAVAWCVEPS